VNRKFLPPALLLLAAALFVVWWLLPSNVLKRRTGALLRTAEVPRSMTEIGRAARGPNVAKFLAEKVAIQRPEAFAGEVPSTMKRDNVAGLYSAAAKYAVRIVFEAPDFEEVTVDDDRATVRFRVDAIAEFPNRRPADGIQVVDTIWRKVDGDWQLTSIGWEETGRE
jgi:hypothetical protein